MNIKFFKEQYARRKDMLDFINREKYDVRNNFDKSLEEETIKNNTLFLDEENAVKEVNRIKMINSNYGYVKSERQRLRDIIYGTNSNNIIQNNIKTNPLIQSVNSIKDAIVNPNSNYKLPFKFRKYQFILDLAIENNNKGFKSDYVYIIDMQDNIYAVGETIPFLDGLTKNIIYRDVYLVLYKPTDSNQIYKMNDLDLIAKKREEVPNFNKDLGINVDEKAENLEKIKDELEQMKELMVKYNETIGKIANIEEREEIEDNLKSEIKEEVEKKGLTIDEELVKSGAELIKKINSVGEESTKIALIKNIENIIQNNIDMIEKAKKEGLKIEGVDFEKFLIKENDSVNIIRSKISDFVYNKEFLAKIKKKYNIFDGELVIDSKIQTDIVVPFIKDNVKVTKEKVKVNTRSIYTLNMPNTIKFYNERLKKFITNTDMLSAKRDYIILFNIGRTLIIFLNAQGNKNKSKYFKDYKIN